MDFPIKSNFQKYFAMFLILQGLQIGYIMILIQLSNDVYVELNDMSNTLSITMDYLASLNKDLNKNLVVEPIIDKSIFCTSIYTVLINSALFVVFGVLVGVVGSSIFLPTISNPTIITKVYNTVGTQTDASVFDSHIEGLKRFSNLSPDKLEKLFKDFLVTDEKFQNLVNPQTLFSTDTVSKQALLDYYTKYTGLTDRVVPYPSEISNYLVQDIIDLTALYQNVNSTKITSLEISMVFTEQLIVTHGMLLELLPVCIALHMSWWELVENLTR